MKKKRTTAGETIIEDIIYDIFSSLPTKSLMRFKCVSRFCNFLTSDPYFADLHRTHHGSKSSFPTNIILGTAIDILYDENDFYTIEDDPRSSQTKKPIHRVKEFDGLKGYLGFEYAKGLFCLWGGKFDRPVLIYNLGTRESRFLPRVSIAHNYCHYFLGFHPEKKNYKILGILFHPTRPSTITRFLVFTLGNTGETWREITNNQATNFYPFEDKGVYIDGSVYFYGRGHNNIEVKIVAFDVRTEEFKIISTWWCENSSSLRQIGRLSNLVEFEGKLSNISTHPKGISIHQWSETGEWVTRLTIETPRPPKVLQGPIYLVSMFCCTTPDKEIAIMKIMDDRDEILLYDLKEKKWRSVEILGLVEIS